MPDFGLLCDLLWSDPDKEVRDWQEIKEDYLMYLELGWSINCIKK